MKNTLAENMLRFGPKNLTESEKRKLQRLAEQTTSQSRLEFLAKLSKIDPVAADMVKNKKDGVQVSTKYVLKYVASGADAQNSTGNLHIFKVGTNRGVPYIHEVFTVIDRASTGSQANDIMLRSKFDETTTLNDNWDNLDENKTQDVINGAIQFIQNNLKEFKQEYHKFTRSENNIKRFWNDNPQTFDRSQYGLWMKTNTGNALNVITIVQDDDLMDNIRFKIKNFQPNGKYPELTIPPSV